MKDAELGSCTGGWHSKGSFLLSTERTKRALSFKSGGLMNCLTSAHLISIRTGSLTNLGKVRRIEVRAKPLRPFTFLKASQELIRLSIYLHRAGELP